MSLVQRYSLDSRRIPKQDGSGDRSQPPVLRAVPSPARQGSSDRDRSERRIVAARSFESAVTLKRASLIASTLSEREKALYERLRGNVFASLAIFLRVRRAPNGVGVQDAVRDLDACYGELVRFECEHRQAIKK